MLREHEMFIKDWEYQRATIRMSNPKFFGVTKEEAKEYKRIIAERQADLYDPETDDIEDDIVADSDYKEVEETILIEMK